MFKSRSHFDQSLSKVGGRGLVSDMFNVKMRFIGTCTCMYYEQFLLLIYTYPKCLLKHTSVKTWNNSASLHGTKSYLICSCLLNKYMYLQLRLMRSEKNVEEVINDRTLKVSVVYKNVYELKLIMWNCTLMRKDWTES